MYLSLNVNLFDKFNRLVALVFDNFWMVDRQYFWDIEYRPQHLTIRNAPHDITLDLQIKKEEVFLTGNLYYNQFLIPVRPAAMNIAGLTLGGVTAEGAKCGIDIHTR